MKENKHLSPCLEKNSHSNNTNSETMNRANPLGLHPHRIHAFSPVPEERKQKEPTIALVYENLSGESHFLIPRGPWTIVSASDKPGTIIHPYDHRVTSTIGVFRASQALRADSEEEQSLNVTYTIPN